MSVNLIINNLPNFKPIVFYSEFLSFEEAIQKIQEKNEVIKSVFRFNYDVYLDDDGLISDNIIMYHQEMAMNARMDISYLKEQLRCWKLENK